MLFIFFSLLRARHFFLSSLFPDWRCRLDPLWSSRVTATIFSLLSSTSTTRIKTKRWVRKSSWICSPPAPSCPGDRTSTTRSRFVTRAGLTYRWDKERDILACLIYIFYLINCVFLLFQGYLGLWTLTTLLDTQKTLEYLAYLGYNYHAGEESQVSALQITRWEKEGNLVLLTFILI